MRRADDRNEVRRLIEEQRGHFVGAIDGQGVLNEVIGAQGQKVEVAQKHFDGQRRRRHFDHRADLVADGRPAGARLRCPTILFAAGTGARVDR